MSPSAAATRPGLAAAGARRRRPRRATALALGVLLGMALLEVALQLAAYWAWQQRPRGVLPTGPVVLCIGDSLTHGLGASPDESYPARLQQQLQLGGTPYAVVNAGIPGQTSADVLERLPTLLRQHRPEVVCLLVGWNDTWARPRPLTAAQVAAWDSDSFPLRWRTGRLLALLGARSDHLAQPAAPPFLGLWHIDRHELFFAADGSGRLDQQPVAWTESAGVIELRPQNSEPFRVRWRPTDGGLEFSLFGWDRYQTLRPGPAGANAGLDEVRDLVRRGAIDNTLRLLAAAEADAPAIELRAAIVLALLAKGLMERAEELIGPLRDAWLQARSRSAGEAVARLHACCGRAPSAMAIAREIVDAHPDSVAAWSVLVDTSGPEQRQRLAAELRRCAAGSASKWRRAELLTELAIVEAASDPEAAIRELCNARAFGIGSDASILAIVRAVRLGADRGALLRAAAAAPIDPRDRDALLSDVRRVATDDAEVFDVLARHVAIAIGLCRSAGARVYLLGYPFAMSAHQAAMATVAAEQGIPFVSTVEAFTAQLANEPREDWFVDPIHCTARGYALMANVVARRLLLERR